MFSCIISAILTIFVLVIALNIYLDKDDNKIVKNMDNWTSSEKVKYDYGKRKKKTTNKN